jgi:hypothetical protein
MEYFQKGKFFFFPKVITDFQPWNEKVVEYNWLSFLSFFLSFWVILEFELEALHLQGGTLQLTSYLQALALLSKWLKYQSPCPPLSKNPLGSLKKKWKRSLRQKSETTSAGCFQLWWVHFSLCPQEGPLWSNDKQQIYKEVVWSGVLS